MRIKVRIGRYYLILVPHFSAPLFAKVGHLVPHWGTIFESVKSAPLNGSLIFVCNIVSVSHHHYYSKTTKPQSNYLCQDILLHLINYLLFINLIIFFSAPLFAKVGHLVPHWGTSFVIVQVVPEAGSA